MDNNTAELLRELAAKLGTTTEYLWGVMVKQAPVAIVGELCLIATIVGSLIALYIIGIKLHKKGMLTEFGSLSGTGCFFVIVALILTFIGIFVIPISIDSIATALFNPEYWALDRIISKIK